MSFRASVLTAGTGLVMVAGLLITSVEQAPAAAPALPEVAPVTAIESESESESESEVAVPLPDGWTVEREQHPDRSVVTDTHGEWLATFTDGASTVALTGPERRFDEDTADHGVSTATWVRVLSEPFDGEVDAEWLVDALDDDSPDVLEVATEYWTGAPDVVNEDGTLISADSGYGPEDENGYRPVGSDWHDFQGVEGIYPDEIDEPDPDEYGHLDCSGYVRILYGVRFGLPMTRREPDGGASIPRRSMQQAAEAPGVVPIENTDDTVDAEQLDRLQAGDLVFFDTPSDDDGVIDHVGIYLGVDDGGHHRFIHSRRSIDGPTMGGDEEGPSILDGDDYFAEGFRSTRRL